MFKRQIYDLVGCRDLLRSEERNRKCAYAPSGDLKWATFVKYFSNRKLWIGRFHNTSFEVSSLLAVAWDRVLESQIHFIPIVEDQLTDFMMIAYSGESEKRHCLRAPQSNSFCLVCGATTLTCRLAAGSCEYVAVPWIPWRQDQCWMGWFRPKQSIQTRAYA